MLQIIYHEELPTNADKVKYKKIILPTFYKCKWCKKSFFTWQRDLDKHIEEFHGEGLKCDHCGDIEI